MVAALCREIALRQTYLPENNNSIQSIYFGGGTPSLLSEIELTQIFKTLETHFNFANNTEITLEANPDDLDKNYIRMLRQLPINRLSIGIQSFHEADLLFMNRAHNAQQALDGVRRAQDADITNLSIDLIYGTPTLNQTLWQQNLNQTIALQVPHVSAYCLTVEPRTALYHFIQKGKVNPPNDEQAAKQFVMLSQTLTQNGFTHYEISNLALPGFEAKHNSSYWQGKPYLGIGPSAHSFNGLTRQWNIAHNPQYIKTIELGQLPVAEVEELTTNQRFNEYLMTSLRTLNGCNLNTITQQFGQTYSNYLVKAAHNYVETGQKVKHQPHVLALAAHARFVSDGIISQLFIIDKDENK